MIEKIKTMLTSDALSFYQLLIAFATAIATIALWKVTKILAIETKRMASSMAQPNIVASLQPNPWSTTHFDISVTNTGNAAAYSIEISSEPPLPFKENSLINRAPLQNISVLKPGQDMTSYLCEFRKLKGNSFKITTKWKSSPNSSKFDSLTYIININDYDGISYLGPRNPLHEIATQIKYQREDWRYVASGSTRIKVDAYTEIDRLREKRKMSREFRSFMRENDK